MIGTRLPDSPVRVLHVHHNPDLYGASRMLLRWLQQADRRRFFSVVVLPEPGPLKHLIEAEGIEVVVHPRLSIIDRKSCRSWRFILFLFNYPLSTLFLWRLIRRKKIDLVYTNTGVILSPALAARIAGVPHVWHIREWFQEFHRIWGLFSWYIRAFSDKIIAISNTVAGQFPAGDKVVVIHDAFSMAEPSRAIGQFRDSFRARYGLGEDFVVGCVGRIKFVRKGQEILVQATALLKSRGKLVKTLIVGAPFPGNEDHLARLRTIAAESGIEDRVIFAGELADPLPAYAAMDILAMPSIQPEPFGGVVSEAMSLGVPVIATNNGGAVDQVVEGVTGLLVPPGDPVALADAIEKLMQDPELRASMSRASAARVREHFSLEKMADSIESVLDEAVPVRRS